MHGTPVTEEQTAQQLPQEQHQKQPEEQTAQHFPRIRLPGGGSAPSIARQLQLIFWR